MTMQAEPRTAVDPVTASIISHGIDAAVDQMLVALKRTAFSTTSSTPPARCTTAGSGCCRR
jgi:hypothetical protein